MSFLFNYNMLEEAFVLIRSWRKIEIESKKLEESSILKEITAGDYHLSIIDGGFEPRNAEWPWVSIQEKNLIFVNSHVKTVENLKFHEIWILTEPKAALSRMKISR